ncbi:MAG: RNA polymerase sigma-54 factor, partial [Flavobacteriales bacterium]
MIRQTFQQKLLTRLSPQQIQLIRMLQIPTLELDQRIKEELESNPALEEGGEEDAPENPEDLMDDSDESTDSEEENEIDYEDYFPDDDTPDYKLKANNHSAD